MLSRRPRPVHRARHRRTARLLLPALATVLVTGSVVGVAVARDERAAGPVAPVAAAVAAPVTMTAVPTDSPYRLRRPRAISRSAERVTLHRKPTVRDHEFRTAPLNLWPAPHERGEPLAVLPEGGRVAVTGRQRAGFAQILYRGQVRWVNATYLAEHKPAPPADSTPSSTSSAASSPGSSAASAEGVSAGGVTSAPCPDGSGTEAGLTSRAVILFRSVCNAFPALTTYGGYDAHGEHSTGRAIDFMVGDSSLGQAVADWARAHAAELDLYDVIWAQHIWTPVRASEGWRLMPDRGSATANHYDHVHISVN